MKQSSLFVWTVRNTVLRQHQQMFQERSEISSNSGLTFAYFQLFTVLIAFIIYLILSFLSITSAEARHRRHHARPETHRDLRNSDTSIRATRQCFLPSWDEVNTTVPYPNATGSAVVDLTGRNPEW
jgi:hypothetical protein